MSKNILVVDDEQSIADLIEVYLTGENYNVYKFYTGQDALACVEQELSLIHISARSDRFSSGDSSNCTADRHLILHLSAAFLYHRCVPR